MKFQDCILKQQLVKIKSPETSKNLIYGKSSIKNEIINNKILDDFTDDIAAPDIQIYQF